MRIADKSLACLGLCITKTSLISVNSVCNEDTDKTTLLFRSFFIGVQHANDRLENEFELSHNRTIAGLPEFSTISAFENMKKTGRSGYHKTGKTLTQISRWRDYVGETTSFANCFNDGWLSVSMKKRFATTIYHLLNVCYSERDTHEDPLPGLPLLPRSKHLSAIISMLSPALNEARTLM